MLELGMQASKALKNCRSAPEGENNAAPVSICVLQSALVISPNLGPQPKKWSSCKLLNGTWHASRLRLFIPSIQILKQVLEQVSHHDKGVLNENSHDCLYAYREKYHNQYTILLMVY